MALNLPTLHTLPTAAPYYYRHTARRFQKCNPRCAIGKKVSIIQLGCPKNVVDGEVILGDLDKAGFSITEDHAEADAIVVNTCAFVEAAKAESLAAIMEAATLGGRGGGGMARKVVVTGCLAQRYAGQLAADLPEAHLVVGFERYASLPDTLTRLLGDSGGGGEGGGGSISRGDDSSCGGGPSIVGCDGSPGPPQSHQAGAGGGGVPVAGPQEGLGHLLLPRVQVGSPTVPFRPEWRRRRLTPRHSAYLRVAEGCNHACTFCAIPAFRGRFRSKPWQAVVEEARHLVQGGAVELNLIAEDTNQYGMDLRDGRGLAHLLRELSKMEGLHWIRILYAYPSYFTDDLIDEIANNPKVCKYLDMPLQHINNLVLLAMNRPTQEHTVKLLTKLRARIPGLALRTTFITGFPGETSAQHRELVDFCRAFKFERMGCFEYSQEEGTPSATLPDQVPSRVRARRHDQLVALQQRVGAQWAQSMVGQEVDVLVDGVDADAHHDRGGGGGGGGPVFIGRTQYDAPDIDPVVLLSPSTLPGVAPLEVGQVRRCLIHGALLGDLEAHPIA